MSDFVPLGGEAPPSRDAFRPFGPPGEDRPTPAPEPLAPEPRGAPAEDGRGAFQAGYALGRQELLEQVGQVGESLVKSLEELADFRARLRDRYERELLELALGVARKVVLQEVAERPEIWLGMIRTAVRRVVDRERIVVRVPAALAQFLRERAPELRAALDEVKDLEVVEDATVGEGGCVIESRFGEVDIGIETQLEATGHALVRAVED